MTEHTGKIVLGALVLMVGTAIVNVGDGLGILGVFINLVGGVILLIGVIGAGVQAGNREVVAELRRASEQTDTTQQR